MATPAGRRPWQQPQQLSVDFEALSYISSLVEAFQAFDSDNDGLVTEPELRGLLASLRLDKPKHEVRDMLARADADRDGRLSVEELLDVMNAGELRLSSLLQSAVSALESAAGPNGVLGADELARLLSVMGTASVENCMEIITCLDGDGDGAMSVEEFRLMAHLLQALANIQLPI